jgi:hypothetical protein
LGKKRIIYEAKDVDKLTRPMINRTKKKYQYPFFPKEIHIAIPSRTKVSNDVRDYAKKKNVKINRLRY